jgi:hypothetical protein
MNIVPDFLLDFSKTEHKQSRTERAISIATRAAGRKEEITSHNMGNVDFPTQ